MLIRNQYNYNLAKINYCNKTNTYSKGFFGHMSTLFDLNNTQQPSGEYYIYYIYSLETVEKVYLQKLTKATVTVVKKN